MLNKRFICLSLLCLSLTSCSLVNKNGNSVAKRDSSYMTEMSTSLKSSVESYYSSLVGETNLDPSDDSIEYVNDSAGLNSFKKLSFYETKSGSSKVINGEMIMVIDVEDYESVDFKFETSPFYGLAQVFGAGNLDYSDLNNKVSNALKNKTYKTFDLSEGQFDCSIEVKPSELKFIISINP